VQRRLSKAASAQTSWWTVEREIACRTAGARQKIELLPASGAKPVIGVDDRTTAGAARRQREIDDRVGKPGEHSLLSRATLGCTSAPCPLPRLRPQSSIATPAASGVTLRPIRKSRFSLA